MPLPSHPQIQKNYLKEPRQYFDIFSTADTDNSLHLTTRTLI